MALVATAGAVSQNWSAGGSVGGKACTTTDSSIGPSAETAMMYVPGASLRRKSGRTVLLLHAISSLISVHPASRRLRIGLPVPIVVEAKIFTSCVDASVNE